MKSYLLSTCALSMALCSSLFAEAPVESFPPEVSFQADGTDYKLQLTGTAVRKKFLVKVYTVGSYVQDAAQVLKTSNKFQDILESDKAKQLTLKWDRDVTTQQAQDAFRDSFKKVFSEGQQVQLKPQIDTFLGFYSNGAKKGDEQELRWLPGGKVDVLVNNQPVGSISNADFAKGLWAIWFGEHSVVERNNLVSQVK